MITKADFEAALLLACLWAQEQEALILRSGVTDAQLSKVKVPPLNARRARRKRRKG